MLKSLIILFLFVLVAGCASPLVLKETDCHFTCSSRDYHMDDVTKDGCICSPKPEEKTQ